MTITVNALARQVLMEFPTNQELPQSFTKAMTFVNDAWKDLARAHDWFWLRQSETIPTVAATQEYSLATTAAEPIAVRLAGTADQELVYTPVEWLQATDLEMQGRPERWFRSGYNSSTEKYKIKLWPVPEAVYSLEVWEVIRPADLSTSSTIPIPEEFMPILKHRIRFHMCNGDKDYSGADRWLALYMTEVKAAWAAHGHPPAQSHCMAENDLPHNQARLPRLPGNYPRF